MKIIGGIRIRLMLYGIMKNGQIFMESKFQLSFWMKPPVVQSSLKWKGQMLSFLSLKW